MRLDISCLGIRDTPGAGHLATRGGPTRHVAPFQHALPILLISIACRFSARFGRNPGRSYPTVQPESTFRSGRNNILSRRKRNRAAQVQAATNFCFCFDFDEWSQLAKDDPFAFEARRIALIEAYLRQFPQSGQRRLRGLQFRIDMERRRARTPMGACLKISSMMWESLLGRHGLKTALDTLMGSSNRSVVAPPRHLPLATSARIIPFRKPAV